MVALATGDYVPAAIFTMAYLVFIVALIWSLGAWLSSQYLVKANPHNWNKNRKKTASNLKWAISKYRTTKWATSSGIVVMFCVCVYSTFDIQVAKELSGLHGLLMPANDPDPSPQCTTQPTDLKVIFGNTVMAANAFPFAAISVQETGKEESRITIVTLNKTSQGNVIFASDVFDQDGKLVARINNNEFSVDEPSIFRTYKERPDRSTLVLTDHYGDQVLYVRLLNRNEIKILGTLFFPGHALPIAKGVGVTIDDKKGINGINLETPLQINHVCMGGFHGGILITLHPK